MGTALLARFPLGIYQAHRANGQPDPFPDVARLFSALVSAAGTGADARAVDGRLTLSDAAIRALRWIEANPPSGLSLPRRRRTRAAAVTSYRAEGVFDSRGGRPRVVGKSIGDAVALAGPVAWIWDVDMPEDIRQTVDELCADVAYLGESDSPVVLEFGDAEPTHRLDPDATAFHVGGEAVRVPQAGRLEELERSYRVAYPDRTPTPVSDRHSFSALPGGTAVSADLVIERRYVPVETPPSAAPWSRVWLLPLTAHIEATDVVGWCVALHRAFAARIPEPAPPIVTGRFGPGVRRPANRLAIQYIDASLTALLSPCALPAGSGALAVMFPREGTAEELGAVEAALRGMRAVYGRHGRIPLGAALAVDAATFWSPAAGGLVRLWRSVTPLVPETRAQTAAGGRWTLVQAAKLSVAFAGRDDIPAVPGRSEARYRGLVAAVEAMGVRVGHVERVTDSHVERYVHKLPDSVVAQPFRAVLDLGKLWDPRALVAVGQSRHLGGGLLVPLDVPAVVAATLLDGSR